MSSRAPSAGCAAESFADHYSQARQFFISQTRGEQHHIASALTFELSKVKTPVIRERMVSHLLNIDETLANKVGTGLGLKAMPKPADAAMPTRQDLDPSPKLSIVENGPQRFEGRKLGILVTDGTDAAHSEGAARPRSPRQARLSRSSRPRSAAPRPATAAGSRPTR